MHLRGNIILKIYLFNGLSDIFFTFGVHLSTVDLRREGVFCTMLREVDRLIYFVRNFGWWMNIIGDRLIYFVPSFEWLLNILVTGILEYDYS